MGVHGEIKEFVVILFLMSHFLILRGAPRALVGFCDPTTGSRLKARSNNCLYQAVQIDGEV